MSAPPAVCATNRLTCGSTHVVRKVSVHTRRVCHPATLWPGARTDQEFRGTGHPCVERPVLARCRRERVGDRRDPGSVAGIPSQGEYQREDHGDGDVIRQHDSLAELRPHRNDGCGPGSRCRGRRGRIRVDDFGEAGGERAIAGVALTLLGLLWILQGADLVRIEPILCVADCEPVTGGSPSWLVAGVATALIGLVVAAAPWRRFLRRER